MLKLWMDDVPSLGQFMLKHNTFIKVQVVTHVCSAEGSLYSHNAVLTFSSATFFLAEIQ